MCASLVCHHNVLSAQMRWWRRGPRAPEGGAWTGASLQAPRCPAAPRLAQCRKAPGGSAGLSCPWYARVIGAGIYAARRIREHCLVTLQSGHTASSLCSPGNPSPGGPGSWAGGCCYLPSVLGPRFPCLGQLTRQLMPCKQVAPCTRGLRWGR